MASNIYSSTTSLNFSNLKSSMNYSTLSLMSVNSSVATENCSVAKINDFNTKDFVFCLTRMSMLSNKELMAAVSYLNPEYTLAETEDDLTVLADERRKYYFVCDSFKGDMFNLLRKKRCRICAPPLLIYIHNRKRSMPETSRPLYNGSMFGVAVCFTGFATKRDAISQLADFVHFMGGSVRKDFSGKITHVVANLAQGQKYKQAMNLGKFIMTENWILQAWEKRHDPIFKATKTEFMDQYQMKPFLGLKICFRGFSDEETVHMQELTLQNDGNFVDITEECTHLVIEESYKLDISIETTKATHVVKQEWFWASIQLDLCAEETLYWYIDEQGTPLGTGSQRGRNKRKHCNISGLSDLLSPGSPFLGNSNKRHSRDGRNSLCSATFDSSVGSPFSLSNVDSPGLIMKQTPQKKLTSRHQNCLELQQTERNYVCVLQTLISVFKEPLEQSANQRAGALLAAEEIKTIFGSIPDLLEVHEKLLASIDALVDNWYEEQSIGKAVHDCADGMIKAYPGFVNYFEMIKETIAKCDKERPRFHAFLKLSLTNPDCHRQSLTELLIRPVQRLPSMSLLLNDILRHTPEGNPDRKHVENAVHAIKNVLTHINEDKRKTETQVQMFEIIREVENCPPTLLSAQRSLISKADILELSEGLVLKCDHLTMFLFNDSIEIAKKKSRAGNTVSMRSPAIQNIQRQQKSYKHVEFIELVSLKTIVDIRDDGNDYKNLFGLIHNSRSTNGCDKLSVFKMAPTFSKNDWIATIIKTMSQNKCTTDTENFIEVIEASELISDKNDVSQDGKERTGSLSKVFKKAKGKVGRAFSLNKTPKGGNKLHNQTLRKAMTNVTPTQHVVSINQTTPAINTTISPTPSEFSVMDFSVCEEK